MKNKKLILIGIICLLLIIGISITYSVRTYSYRSNEKQEVKTMNLNLNLYEMKSIDLSKSNPVIDKLGEKNEPMEFEISNTNDNDLDFSLSLIDKDIESTIKNEFIRYKLVINDIENNDNTLKSNGVFYTGKIKKDQTIKFKLILWIDSSYKESGTTYNKVISVNVGSTNLDLSGANEPILESNMIPVYYDIKADTWRKADKDNSNLDYQWYDYNNYMWANIVTVNKEVREDYINAELGKKIDLSDVNSFFVWIPRYKYTIFNKLDMINIEFERGISKTGTVKCNNKIKKTTQTCYDNINGEIKPEVSTLTHPAFTFDNTELTGIWVSKFEPSTNYLFCNEAIQNNNVKVLNDACNKDLELLILPNNYAINAMNVNNQFYNYRRMEIKDNPYGFENKGVSLNGDGTIIDDSNDLDIHMLKNTEYGLVSYFYHSKYGKFNDNYEINNISLLTGSTYINNSLYSYNSDKPVSTTSNVYGIYDWGTLYPQYVLVNRRNTNNTFKYNELEKLDNINPIYYDKYYINDFNMLGDATKETNEWYKSKIDYNPEFKIIRGNLHNETYNVNDSVFSINSVNKITNFTSRPILVIKPTSIYITK